MNFSCPYCGGSRLEHLRTCPKVYSIIRKKQPKKAKKDYFGEAPNVFVGRYGYPNVHVGMLSNEELPEDADSPRTWSAKNFEIPDVVSRRSALINSRFKTNVKSFDEKFLDITREVSMAQKPVDVEVHLDKAPTVGVSLDRDVTVFGPTVNLEKARVTENPSITRQVDRVVSDDDLKATDALAYLHDKGYDEHFLTKLISVGNLGVSQRRKMVPTRWSITAVDDTLGKKLTEEVKDFKQSDHMAYFGGYMGNYYLILMFPDVWSYELFEMYVGDKGAFEYATDYEGYGGRTSYASNTVGGYYASRLAVLEQLKARKRQAGVLALRFITDEYYMALGVWVVREASRRALDAKPIRFAGRDLMLKYAKSLMKKKYGVNILNKSLLLRQIKHQKKLSEWD